MVTKTTSFGCPARSGIGAHQDSSGIGLSKPWMAVKAFMGVNQQTASGVTVRSSDEYCVAYAKTANRLDIYLASR
jgi:hypothetical protein